MKYFLQENFKEFIFFTPANWIHGNSIIVHAYEVNPVDYAIASIIVAGMRDEEIVQQKINAQVETGITFPLSAENLSAIMRT